MLVWTAGYDARMDSADTARAPGRRERKKAATRQAIADAALLLFLERGYDRVSVKDVAEEADVSTTTVFKHFPSKEALVFDEDAERERALVALVRDRAPGRSITGALREGILPIMRPSGPPGVSLAEFIELVRSTPALREYAGRMWMRHEAALARAIAEEVGAGEDDAACRALARFALEAPRLARAHGDAHGDAQRTLDRVFDLLEDGWSALFPSPRGCA